MASATVRIAEEPAKLKNSTDEVSREGGDRNQNKKPEICIKLSLRKPAQVGQAMKIATGTPGVESAKIDQQSSLLIVQGSDIDHVLLIASLRKKLRCTVALSRKEEAGDNEKEEKGKGNERSSYDRKSLLAAEIAIARNSDAAIARMLKQLTFDAVGSFEKLRILARRFPDKKVRDIVFSLYDRMNGLTTILLVNPVYSPDISKKLLLAIISKIKHLVEKYSVPSFFSFLMFKSEFHDELNNIRMDIDALLQVFAQDRNDKLHSNCDTKHIWSSYSLPAIQNEDVKIENVVKQAELDRYLANYKFDIDFIGRKLDIKMLLGLLLDEEKQLQVISILGVPGIGKTSLAAKVFGIVRDHRYRFHSCIWIDLLGDYQPEDILKVIAKEVLGLSREELEKTKVTDLGRHIEQILGKRRFFIVIDDLWKEDSWDIVKRYIPDNGNGSRVLITTPDTVKNHCTRAIELSVLNEEESYELLMHKVFLNYDTNQGILNEFEELGRNIAKSCCGLPLSILLLGGLLSDIERTPFEWTRLLESLKIDQWKLSDILQLIWNEIPEDMKCCLFYFTTFPKNYDINANKLIRLWIAAGIVDCRKRETPEMVAENILCHIIQRHLIQVSNTNYIGRPDAYRLHGPIYQLSVLLNLRTDLLFASCDDESQNFCPSLSVRHLTLQHAKCANRISTFACLEILQSFCFQPKLDLSKLRFLRILDLDGAGLKKMPTGIQNLIQLCYLGLRGNAIRSMPSSITLLRNLQTFDIRENSVKLSLGSIWEITSLRHIYGFALAVPPAISGLKDLHTLDVVKAGLWMNISLPVLTSLCVLKLHGSELLEMDPFECTQLPPNLIEVHLSWASLHKSFLTLLGELLYLRILSLSFLDYEDMPCESASFPRLEVFIVKNLWRLKKWTLDDGAMQQLTHLTIENCDLLNALPEALSRRTNLCKLNLDKPSRYKFQRTESVCTSMKQMENQLQQHEEILKGKANKKEPEPETEANMMSLEDRHELRNSEPPFSLD